MFFCILIKDFQERKLSLILGGLGLTKELMVACLKREE